MQFDKKEVERVAHLSRLELDDAMAARMADQLRAILEYVNQLETLDTSAVSPMSHPEALSNVFRDDAPTPSTERERSLQNAPDQTDGFFRVPRVIE